VSAIGDDVGGEAEKSAISTMALGGYLINGNVEAIECALRHMPDGSTCDS
jgi:hypothetical protein